MMVALMEESYNVRLQYGNPRGNLIKSRMNLTFIIPHLAGRNLKWITEPNALPNVASFYSAVAYRILSCCIR